MSVTDPTLPAGIVEFDPFSDVFFNNPFNTYRLVCTSQEPLGATPRSSATCLLVTPCCAQANTIRDRNANACDDLARRDHRISWSRSSSANTNSAFGRPVLATRTSYRINA
jgi:hypothetical protein